jgi:hypothetical protein
MIDVEVKVSGPVFDGRAGKAVDDFFIEAEDHVADEGVNLVGIWLGLKLRNPTGFYESRIVSDRQRDDAQVTDSKVVYGPWLEGVSSRNQSSRFKGYRTFRIVAQDLQGDASRLAEEVLPKYLDRMNG